MKDSSPYPRHYAYYEQRWTIWLQPYKTYRCSPTPWNKTHANMPWVHPEFHAWQNDHITQRKPPKMFHDIKPLSHDMKPVYDMLVQTNMLNAMMNTTVMGLIFPWSHGTDSWKTAEGNDLTFRQSIHGNVAIVKPIKAHPPFGLHGHGADSAA